MKGKRHVAGIQAQISSVHPLRTWERVSNTIGHLFSAFNPPQIYEQLY